MYIAGNFHSLSKNAKINSAKYSLWAQVKIAKFYTCQNNQPYGINRTLCKNNRVKISYDTKTQGE